MRRLDRKKGVINPYNFVSSLFKNMPKNANVITGDGTAAVVAFKGAVLKKIKDFTQIRVVPQWVTTFQL